MFSIIAIAVIAEKLILGEAKLNEVRVTVRV
jgi:hypothetical protein